mgnify:CR=1 FL=1
MAKATKLPSGAWRVQVSKTVKGVVVRKSFTVHPDDFGGDSRKAKDKAELLARKWRLSKKAENRSKPTLKKAMEQYIDDHKNTISGSTYRGYCQYIKFYDQLLDCNIERIESEDIQRLVNKWSVKLTKKTIKNRLSFLYATLKYFGIENDFDIGLSDSKNPSKKVLAPETDEVKLLFDNAEGSYKAVIALAAFGTLRRGEIAALKQKDIDRENNIISVHADMIETIDESGKPVIIYKNHPKTHSSIRIVELPDFVMELLPVSNDPESFVFEFGLNELTKKFMKLRKKVGLTCSLHSLRHYAASFRSDLQIPAKYIEEAGGWRHDSKVLKQVYDNRLAATSKKYAKLANDFVEENFYRSKDDNNSKKTHKRKMHTKLLTEK